MKTYLSIGSSPCDEDCAQVGTEGYDERAKEECDRYIAAIRATVGPEAIGAKLAVMAFPHDFGTYYEVVCHYDNNDLMARAYVLLCESDGPMTWPEGYRTREEYNAKYVEDKLDNAHADLMNDLRERYPD